MSQINIFDEIIVDNFAGGGGASTGIELAAGSKGLVAYSSTGHGHEGTVYQADGWFEVSRSRAARDYREGRKNLDTTAKIKWVRSP